MLSACVPSRAGLTAAALLTALALLDRLASQGARIGAWTFPRLGLFVAAAAALAFLSAKAETQPLRARPMLASLLALVVAGGLLFSWRDSLFTPRRPLRVAEAGAPLPLQLHDRRELDSLLGRPRQIGFTATSLLYAPESGRYRFELLCDDRCQLGIDRRRLEPVAGSGSVEVDLAQGVHELQLSYQQGGGPARLSLAWDRPARFELIGLSRYVGQQPADVDAAAIRSDHVRAAALLLSEALIFFFGFCWLLRSGEHVRVHAARQPRAAWKACLVIAAAVLLAVLVDRHVTGMNGPEYWRWPWRRLDGPALFLALSVPLVAFFAAQRLRASPRLALPLLMLSSLALQLLALGMARAPISLADVERRVRDPGISGYSAEAARIDDLRGWLRAYPQLSASFHAHAQTKPPGPILFHVAFQRTLGVGARSARAAGLAIGVLACLAIPACFFLIRLLTGSADAAFHGASFLALSPGPILFFPELDQAYPLLSCALAGSWALALVKRRLGYAAFFGLALSVALFTSYSFLTLGLFLGLVSLSAVVLEKTASPRFALAAVAAALGTVVACYAALFAVTGFDPLATFQAALANQARLLPSLNRPYPASVLFDLLDFAMGAGWISVLLVAFFLAENLAAGLGCACVRVALFALLQLAGLALSGLLQTETARVWQFLLPLYLCPVGCELAGWRPAPRNAVYLCLWLLTVTLCRNMAFIG